MWLPEILQFLFLSQVMPCSRAHCLLQMFCPEVALGIEASALNFHPPYFQRQGSMNAWAPTLVDTVYVCTLRA